MNILINMHSSQKDAKDHFHGGNEYTNRIIVELLNRNISIGQNLYFFCHSKELIDSNIVKNIQSDNRSYLIDKKECSRLEDAIRKFNIDRLFDPLGVQLGTHILENVNVIFTIHGLRPIEMPTDINEYYLESKLKFIIKRMFLKYYKKKLKKDFQSSLELKAKSQKLIVVSEHTKYTIASEFCINPEDISVFYSPEKIFPIINENDEKLFFQNNREIEKSKYFLLVSSKRWIKNTFRAVKAFDELINSGLVKYKIVLTGSDMKVKSLIKNKNMFCALDYVETKELEVLYKNAYALIYPSLNEGFGYPPIEAMKYGTPVVASMITSIPEIVGDAALGFNPFSTIEIKTRILQIQNDQKIYETLKKKGSDRYDFINLRQKADLEKLLEIILS